MENTKVSLPIADVVFRKDLYPRLETSALTVQKYADDLSTLPPIEVNQHNEIIDGWHRWTAHKKVGAVEIDATITRTNSDSHLLELAIERNASHGLQLSQDDKRDMARRLYHSTPEKDRDARKRQLAKLLSVSERTIRDWLSRIDKDAKDARNKTIFAMWMACHTQEEIQKAVGCHQTVVGDVVREMADLPKTLKPAAEHLVDFDPPLYNVWRFQDNGRGSSKHPGNSQASIVDSLLYLYTQPFGIVVDPFAGGGSTIDVCRKRYRRFFASDLSPIPEREHEIRKWDITQGLPAVPRWKDVNLVYLDPPYWKQLAGKYSDGATDLSNMDLGQFTATLISIIRQFGEKLANGYIALLLQPTQWKAPNRAFTDHVADIMRETALPIAMRISCPYETQQCTAQMVTWAKEQRTVLVLTRELVIWKVERCPK